MLMKSYVLPLLSLLLIAAPACDDKDTPTAVPAAQENTPKAAEAAKKTQAPEAKTTVKATEADKTKKPAPTKAPAKAAPKKPAAAKPATVKPAAAKPTTAKPAPPKPAAAKGEIPWNFPPQKVLKAEVGQLALGIDPYRLKDAQKAADPEKAFGMSYTNFTFTAVGDFESKVRRVSETTLPNSLIIPLPKSDPAKKGDVLLTWWQTGGGLQRAFVVGGSPEQPEVWYMDLGDNLDDGKKTHVLKPSSFAVLGSELEPGIEVMWDEGAKKHIGTVLSIGADKLLVMSGNKIRTAPKTAKVIPVQIAVKKGDTVWYPGFAEAEEGTVLAIDAKKGKVTVKGRFGEKTVPFGRILKK